MNRLMILVSALLLALGFSASTAFAADPPTLPSSPTAARPWLKMNSTTFPVSTVSVLEQFDRVSRYDLRLMPQDRARLDAMLETGQGIEVWVPDGIGLDYLTGRVNGKPGVYRGMRKQLGGSHRALMFDLGNGKTVYWFTGQKGISCNNIGVVIYSPPPIAFQSPPLPKKVVCRMVAVRSTDYEGVGYTQLPGFILPSCCPQCVPSQFIGGLGFQTGSPSNSTEYIRVCE